MMFLQIDVSPDSPSWPLWPFLVLAGLLVLPGASIIALAFLAWIKSPQRDVTQPKALDESSSAAEKTDDK
ncbi:MAG TPA: hypothetical protein VH370_03480 [Humisphaera sp.]|jgi:hypothetical protein|nr:hypothetical protein [Humisphaera sp.]